MKIESLLVLALTLSLAACGDDSSSSSFAGGDGSGDKGSEYDADAGTVKDLRDGQRLALPVGACRVKATGTP